MNDVTTEIELTDSQKIQIVQESRKLRKQWNKLANDQKRQVLEGMDIATDEKWVLGLLEEV